MLWNCSGDIYAGVPTVVPVRVRSVASASVRGRGPSLVISSTCCTRTSPKSITSTRPPSPTITLSGLKSRCTSPLRCAAASPRPACIMTAITSLHVRGLACSHCRSVTPCTSSIARNTWPSCVPTSCTAMTLGWLTRAIAWASRSNRSSTPGLAAAWSSSPKSRCMSRPSTRASPSSACSRWSSLSATRRSSSGSYAA